MKNNFISKLNRNLSKINQIFVPYFPDFKGISTPNVQPTFNVAQQLSCTNLEHITL